MDALVEGVRKKAYGNKQQPNEINGLAALKPMLERVLKWDGYLVFLGWVEVLNQKLKQQ